MTTPIGYGCDFQMSIDGGNTYTSVGDVRDIDQPQMKIAKINKTKLLSANRAKEKGPGMLDAGETGFTLLMKAAKLAAIYAQACVEGLYFRLVYSDTGVSTPSYWQFNGHFSEMGGGKIEAEGEIMQDFKVEITGKPTFVQAV